jgi:hypothetical protein
LRSQKFAVLPTHDDGLLFCTLVAFAETGNCTSIVFVTNRNTSVYKNLIRDNRVPALVDNGMNQTSDLEDAVSLVLIGNANEITQDTNGYYRYLFTAKHKSLSGFISIAENSLFRVNINEHIVAALTAW